MKGPRVGDRQIADRALRKLQVELDEDRADVGPKRRKAKTFDEWAAEYLTNIERDNGAKGSTIRGYGPTLRYASPIFGSLDLDEIGIPELRLFVRAIRKNDVDRRDRPEAPEAPRRRSSTPPSTRRSRRGTRSRGSSCGTRPARVPRGDRRAVHRRRAREALGADGELRPARPRLPVRREGGRRDRRAARRVDRAELGRPRPDRQAARDHEDVEPDRRGDSAEGPRVPDRLPDPGGGEGLRDVGRPRRGAARGLADLPGPARRRAPQRASSSAGRIDDARVKAGIPDVGKSGRKRKPFHAFRATFDRICREQGLDPEWRKAQMGHATVEQNEEYGETSKIWRRKQADGVKNFPV